MATWLCVASDIHRCVVMLCSAQEGRDEEYKRLRERMASYLFTAPVCGVICSLVGLSVSENSSVAPCGCVMAGTSRELGGGTYDHTPDSQPHHQCDV